MPHSTSTLRAGPATLLCNTSLASGNSLAYSKHRAVGFEDGVVRKSRPAKEVRMNRIRAFVAVCLFSLVLSSANAQDYRGKVQGVVADSSQAVLVGAKVSLANDKTGIVSVKETNASGRYFFDLVDPGAYTISVEAAGFSKFVQQNMSRAE